MKRIFFILSIIFLNFHSFAQLQNNNKRIFNIRLFGGKGDGTYLYDVSTTNTSATITSSTASFSSADIGKTILVNGAGSAGSVLRTTIASITNSTTAVLSATASATISSDTLIYGTNNTAALQAAITACANSGGGTVFAPVGIYLFSSALSGNGNAQVSIPVDSGTGNNRKVVISIEGETVYGGAPSSFLNASTGIVQTKGTIFYSTISGSGTIPCFIGSGDQSTGNRNDLSISNIGIMVYSNHGASAVSMTAINGGRFEKIDVYRCTISPDVEVVRSASPINSEVAGIIAGAVNDNGENMIIETQVVGFKYALVAGEHTRLNGNLFFANINGIVLPIAYHAISGHSQVFACVNEIYSPTTTIFGQTAGASNIDLTIESEWDTAAGYLPAGIWYTSVNNISDSGGHLSGAVRINIVSNGANANATGAHTYGVDTTKLAVSTFSNPYAFLNTTQIFTKNQTISNTGNASLKINTTGSANQSSLIFLRSNAIKWQAVMDWSNVGTNDFSIYDQVNGKVKLFFDPSGAVNVGGTASVASTSAIAIDASKNINFNNGDGYFDITKHALGLGTTTISDANGNNKLKIVGTPGTDVLSLSDGTSGYGFFINNSGAIPMGIGSITNDNIGFFTNNNINRLVINTHGDVIAGDAITSSVFRTTNAGSDINAKFTTNTGASVSTAASLGFAFENANGLVFEAANGTREIARATIKLTNLTNTAASESGDLIFSTQQTAGNAVSESWRIANTGQLSNTGAAGTAYVTLKAGTATAGTAPLRFTSGTNLTTPVDGALEYNGTDLQLDVSSTRYVLSKALTGSATLDFASTNAQNSSDLTITVTGAASGDVVLLGVPNGSTLTNSDFTAWVSTTDTVTVRFNNYSSGAQDPASGTFKVRVIK